MSLNKCILALLGLVLLIGCSSKPAAVGSYIYSDTDGALMVQIASVKDGRVNGSWSVVTASDAGKTEAVTLPLSGTIEGDTLNMSVENGSGLSLVTGALDGDNLRLTIFANGNSTKATLKKTDASKFEKLANGQRFRAAEKLREVETIAASKEQINLRSKTQGSIDRLAESIFDKSQEVTEKTKKMDVVIAGYRADYGLIRKMQNAQRKLDAESDADAFRISQLDYQIDGISNNLENVHGQVQSYANSLNGFLADADIQSTRYLAECAADNLLNCSRLVSARELLTVKSQQFRKENERENAIYKPS